MTYCTGHAQDGTGLGATTALDWTGWGAADKSTRNDRAQPEQQNPLVPYIERYYIPGYMRLSEKNRQKAFGAAHKRKAFQSEPGLHELGGDGLKTGEPKAFTNYLEVQQGSLLSRLAGGVGSVIGKLAKPLVVAVVPGGALIVGGLEIGKRVVRGGRSGGGGVPSLPPPSPRTSLPSLPPPREPEVTLHTGPLPEKPRDGAVFVPGYETARMFQPSPLLIGGLVAVALLPTLLNRR